MCINSCASRSARYQGRKRNGPAFDARAGHAGAGLSHGEISRPTLPLAVWYPYFDATMRTRVPVSAENVPAVKVNVYSPLRRSFTGPRTPWAGFRRDTVTVAPEIT